MPHYGDGTEAKVGDVVFGVSANRGPITGVVVKVETSRTECNLVVAFNFSGVWDHSTFQEMNMRNRMDFMAELGQGRRRRVMVVDAQLLTGGSISRDGILVGGSSELMDFETDYGDADQFAKVGTPECDHTWAYLEPGRKKCLTCGQTQAAAAVGALDKPGIVDIRCPKCGIAHYEGECKVDG